ncbi:MAG: NUDIX hydrolase [Candidatus Dormibacteria bacterium]
MAGGRAPNPRIGAGPSTPRRGVIVQLRRPTTIEIRAAGGVVWRATAGGDRLYAVVHRPAYDDWSLPKGKLADGESEIEGALREVEEETGMSCRLDRLLGTTSYIDRKGRPKVVVYWLMQATGGTFEPSEEIDEVRWLPLADVQALLTYPRDRTLLGALLVERFELAR